LPAEIFLVEALYEPLPFYILLIDGLPIYFGLDTSRCMSFKAPL